MKRLLLVGAVLFSAASLLGQGQQLFNLPAVPDLEHRIGLEWLDMERVGEDLRLRAKVLRRPPAT